MARIVKVKGRDVPLLLRPELTISTDDLVGVGTLMATGTNSSVSHWREAEDH
jgi:hypothetical protein